MINEHILYHSGLRSMELLRFYLHPIDKRESFCWTLQDTLWISSTDFHELVIKDVDWPLARCR